MSRYYRIAEHTICIEDEALEKLVAQDEGFVPFAIEQGGNPVLTVRYKAEAEAPEWTKKLYHVEQPEVDSTNNFGLTAKGYRFTSTQAGEELTLWTEGEGMIMMTGKLVMHRVHFALWIAYGIATAAHSTIAIHTSCIVYQGKATIFLGESGTGKSTHTRLWRENILGATLLNDDSPILRVDENGEVRMHGSPWSGKTPCYKTESYPLAACVRLSQAPYNRIKRLDTLRAFASLHPSCPPDFAYDEHLYDCICDTLSRVLDSVPVYHLECLPDGDAARLSWSTIFKGDEA